MNKIVITMLLIMCASAVYADGYCPTSNEFQNKMQYFQAKALRLMSTNSSEQEADAYMREQDNYLNSVFPGCLRYFQTSPAPDCSKLQMLSTSYIMLDKGKKPAAKNSIMNLPSSLQTKCPIDYKTMQIFIAD